MAANRKRRGDVVNGMLLLDKPAGYSSNQALQKVKHLFNAQKAGHTGSLDPIATGLLPLCFGETTKVSGLFLTADKTYEVSIKLGVTTETGDSEGSIVSQQGVDVNIDKIQAVIDGQIGTYGQVPPMYSALKKNGQPLYKLARQGISVEREPREVTVYDLQLNQYRGDTLDLTVSCSKGFYVRTMAEQIGKDLGCGGHVTVLRRTKLGAFDIAQSYTLDQLQSLENNNQMKELLLSTDNGLQHLPQIRLPENLAQYLLLGQSVRVPPHSKFQCDITEGFIRLYSESNQFLGLGEMDEDKKILPKRMFNN